MLGFAFTVPFNSPTVQAEVVRQLPVADEIVAAPAAPVAQTPAMWPVPFHGVGIFDENGGAVAIKFKTEDGRFYEIPFVTAPEGSKKPAVLKPTRNPRGNVKNLPLDRN